MAYDTRSVTDTTQTLQFHGIYSDRTRYTDIRNNPTLLTPPITERTVYVEISSTVEIPSFRSSAVIPTGGCSINSIHLTALTHNPLGRPLPSTELNKRWRFGVGLPNNSIGVVTLIILDDEFSGNDSTSTTFEFDTRPEIDIKWRSAHYCPTSKKLSAELIFKGNITNIINLQSTDFVVVQDPDIIHTNWVLDPIPEEAAAGVSIPIRFSAPDDANGRFKLRFKADSVRLEGAPTNNLPESDLDTGFQEIADINVTWYASAFCNDTGKIETNIKFGKNISSASFVNVAPDPNYDLEVLRLEKINDTDSTILSGWSHIVKDAYPLDTSRTNEFQIITTAPDNTKGLFRLRLKANSVTFGSSNFSGPKASSLGYEFFIDNRSLSVEIAPRATFILPLDY